MAKTSDQNSTLANQIDVPCTSHAAAPPAAVSMSAPRAEPWCGDFDIRIARDGTWLYRDSPIGRMALVKLFASVLRRESDGAYWLVTPFERGRIRVDDAPFTAVELTVEGAGQEQALVFRTNLDEFVTAGPDHPIRVSTACPGGGPRPYLLARPGLEALIVRPVYYQLIELGVEGVWHGESRLGVWSRGEFFVLGRLEEEA